MKTTEKRLSDLMKDMFSSDLSMQPSGDAVHQFPFNFPLPPIPESGSPPTPAYNPYEIQNAELYLPGPTHTTDNSYRNAFDDLGETELGENTSLDNETSNDISMHQ